MCIYGVKLLGFYQVILFYRLICKGIKFFVQLLFYPLTANVFIIFLPIFFSRLVVF